MLRDIYLSHGGWSIAAAVGTATILGAIAAVIVGALQLRTPHPRRRGVGELLTRAAARIGDILGGFRKTGAGR